MCYGLYDLKGCWRKMGRNASMDKLLLFCMSYPWRRKNGNCLADTKRL